ncbi:Methyltransferase-like protein 21D [Lobulomyces angularis]|nr:Methyltransferase-like protein 21D [Lobulomyces angularis]
MSYIYHFNDGSQLDIIQDLNGNSGIGSTVWDSSLILCKFFEKNPSLLLKKNVVYELGSGTGISGLVLGMIMENLKRSQTKKVQINLTDKEVALSLIKLNLNNLLTKYNSNLKSVDFNVTKLDWLEKGVGYDVADLIILTDCVHWENLFDPLIETLSNLSQKSVTEIYLVYEQRNFDCEAKFFIKLSNKFKFSLVNNSELDPVFRAEDIFVFKIEKKI